MRDSVTVGDRICQVKLFLLSAPHQGATQPPAQACNIQLQLDELGDPSQLVNYSSGTEPAVVAQVANPSTLQSGGNIRSLKTSQATQQDLVSIKTRHFNAPIYRYETLRTSSPAHISVPPLSEGTAMWQPRAKGTYQYVSPPLAPPSRLWIAQNPIFQQCACVPSSGLHPGIAEVAKASSGFKSSQSLRDECEVQIGTDLGI